MVKHIFIFSSGQTENRELVLSTAEKHCNQEQGKSQMSQTPVKAAAIRAVAEGMVRWLKGIKEHPRGK